MNFAVVPVTMTVNALFAYVAFPAIFLAVATLNPRNMAIKSVCIVLAYFSVVLLDGSVFGSTTIGTAAGDGIMGKNTSPFGLVCLGISLWGFVLIGSGTGQSQEKDNDR
jgi:hypothetical protein